MEQLQTMYVEVQETNYLNKNPPTTSVLQPDQTHSPKNVWENWETTQDQDKNLLSLNLKSFLLVTTQFHNYMLKLVWLPEYSFKQFVHI